jgi:DNA-binding NarL/FixJ family response regulator
MTPRQIVIVDDHPLLASGLQRELQAQGAGVKLLDPMVGPERVMEAISDCRPDCAVVDLGLPFTGGGSALIGPLVADEIRVVVLTGETERQLLAQSLGDGAEAVICKSEPLADIVETILHVAGGKVVRLGQRTELAAELHRMMADQDLLRAPFAELSPREQQVLAGLMHGYGATALAERHYVSVATIRAQIRSVLSKLGVGSQLEAVVLAYRNRWSLGDGQR